MYSLDIRSTATANSVEPVRTALYPITDMHIDPRYQRHLSEDKVKKMVSGFNEKSLGVLLLNIREDGLAYVIDGQHRYETMKRRGKLYAECKVYFGLTLKEEAQIFIDANVRRGAVKAIEVFRARLIEEDATALHIQALVEKHGFTLQFTRNHRIVPKSIVAIYAIEEIYQRGKDALLEEVLILVTQAWPQEVLACEGKFLLGLAKFHIKWQGKYSREEFLAKMAVTDIRSIFRRAQYHMENGEHGAAAIAKALKEAYNKHKHTRTRLED